MALEKHKTEWTPAPAPVPRARVDSTIAAPSPARALQQLLDERTSAAADVQRWSRRRQLAFIVVSSCALWFAIIAAFTEAVKLVA